MIRELSGLIKIRGDETTRFSDVVAIEEPLEIRLAWTSKSPTDSQRLEVPQIQKTVAITMRSPGHDIELAVGFLFTEGIIEIPSDIVEVAHCGPVRDELEARNVIKVKLASGISLSEKLQKLERNFYTTSSCGVCGKSSIEALKTVNRYVRELREVVGPSISRDKIRLLPEILRSAQSTFEKTGGLHGAALFDSAGALIVAFEDVGRHNAVDKLMGRAFLAGGLPLHSAVLMLSGRISFELVQKAAMAGVLIIVAIGAPSSLAVELAEDLKITLVGFLRGSNFNIYTTPWRIG